MIMFSRRQFLQLSVAGTVLSLPFGRMAFANSSDDPRFILLILRGGMDGLAAVPAYGDQYYADLRGSLALSGPNKNHGILDLDGYFGLHPNLKNLHKLYRQNELAVIHAVATPYRERSHFDGQKLLENGTTHPLGASDGWLNRTLSYLPASTKADRDSYAIALAHNIPLVLYGQQAVNSWAPAVLPEVDPVTIARIAQMYAQDEFFSAQFQSALKTRELADDIAMDEIRGMGRRGGIGQLTPLIKAAGNFLSDAQGPRIAVLESGGWDTHANQGAANGQLANRFSGLDEHLTNLKTHLGTVWDKTVIAVVSEFGRTVAVNGSNGTDHGTAGVVFIAGGAINGGKIITDWPGLAKSNLYEGRDLYPTLDMRGLFMTILHDHLNISRHAIEKNIFPGGQGVRMFSDLIA